MPPIPDLNPRTNTALFGHEEAESLLMDDFASGKLAHGWIIGGPKGIGKATLAYRFARALLSAEPKGQGLFGDETATFAAIGEEHPVFRRIVAGSHADLLVVEPAYDEKKEEFARELSVDQARSIAQFLSLTPGESQWRVVIVDPVDALNTNGANAILKILEEPPPQAVLILISHNPGLLLPTIRSRCRTLRLKPLDDEQFRAVMNHAAPDGLDYNSLAALSQLSAGSPGIALELWEQGAADIYQEITALLTPLPQVDLAKLHVFAEKMGSGKVHANWLLLTRLLLFAFERITRQAAGAPPQPLSAGEGAMLRQLPPLHGAAGWAEKWQQCAEQFSLAQRLHLDYKQVIITFFHSIASHEGFHIGNAA